MLSSIEIRKQITTCVGTWLNNTETTLYYYYVTQQQIASIWRTITCTKLQVRSPSSMHHKTR